MKEAEKQSKKKKEEENKKKAEEMRKAAVERLASNKLVMKVNKIMAYNVVIRI